MTHRNCPKLSLPEANTWKQHEGENTCRSDAGIGTTATTSKRPALAQEGNFAEPLTKNELEANELRTRLAKPEEAEGADDEEEGAQEAAAAAVNLVQKESLARAMKRLTSHGIASLGAEETEKVSALLEQEAPPPLPSREFPHIDGEDQRHGTGREGGGGRIRDSVRALQTAVGRPRSGGLPTR